MSHLHRFYVPELALDAPEVVFEGEEAHHALRVVRLRIGEPVALFDGRGGECRGSVAGLGKRDVIVGIEESRRVDLPSRQLTLIQAWLKRDKHIDEIVRHGTELGVSRFEFFRASRSERVPAIDPKWSRIAVESCKQSGRLWLPEFNVAGGIERALGGGYDSVVVADMDGPPVPLGKAVRGQRVAVVVGPEGNLSPEELGLCREHGAASVSLGTTTFRSEVAAGVVCTLVLYELGVLGVRV